MELDILEEDILITEETESDLGAKADNFGEAVVWGTDWTTETIARQLEKGNIDLTPSFQRRDAWSDEEKSKLIESLMLGIPIPPIILAENKARKNSYIVIDGKQRLLAIRRFYSKEPAQNVIDKDEAFPLLALKSLFLLKECNGKNYFDLVNEGSDYVNNVDNQAIRTVIIKNWPDEEFLYTVFLRLNTGSKKLTPQELRQALKSGPFLDYIEKESANSKQILRMLNNKKPDARMRDVELVLRFFAYRYSLEEYDGNLKNFLDMTCDKLNKCWIESEKYQEEIQGVFTSLENLITFSYALMDDMQPFSRYTAEDKGRKFNRSIFEIFSYYLIDENVQNCILENKDLFKEKFSELNQKREFVSCVSDTTKETKRVVKRHDLFLEMLLLITKGKGLQFNKLNLNSNNKVVIEKVRS